MSKQYYPGPPRGLICRWCGLGSDKHDPLTRTCPSIQRRYESSDSQGSPAAPCKNCGKRALDHVHYKGGVHYCPHSPTQEQKVQDKETTMRISDGQLATIQAIKDVTDATGIEVERSGVGNLWIKLPEATLSLNENGVVFSIQAKGLSDHYTLKVLEDKLNDLLNVLKWIKAGKEVVFT